MTDTIRIIPPKGFDYVNTGNPSATTNPPVALVTWLNATNGNLFICTDNTVDANVWKLRAGFRGALAYTTTTQNMANNTWTTLSFELEEYDTDSFHDLTTNPERLTIPSGVSKVRLSTCFMMDNNTSGRRLAKITKNGDVFNGIPSFSGDGDSYPAFQFSSAIVEVVVGDYFEVEIYQTSGATRTVLVNPTSDTNPWFCIEVIE